MHFTKLESIRIDATCTLNQWASASGLTVYHFVRKTAQLKGSIIVDTRKGDSYEKALLLSHHFEEYCNNINHSGKHPYSHYTCRAAYESSEYTIASYGWPCFKGSLKLFFKSILNREVRNEFVPQMASTLQVLYALSGLDILHSSMVKGIYDLELPFLNYLFVTSLEDLREFRAITHRPENMYIMIDGEVEEQELLATIGDLEGLFDKHIHREGKKVVMPDKQTFPHGEVIDLGIPDFPGQSVASWKFNARDPIHLVALWILRPCIEKKLRQTSPPYTTPHFEESIRSIFTISSEEPFGPDELGDLFATWPRSYQDDIIPMRDVIVEAISIRWSYAQRMYYDYIRSSFLYENKDLSLLKEFMEARQHLKTLLLWDVSDWKMIIDLYLVETPPFKVNLIALQSLTDLRCHLEVDLIKKAKDTHNYKISDFDDRIDDIEDCKKIHFPSTNSYKAGDGQFSRRIKYTEDKLGQDLARRSKDIPLSIHLEDYDSDTITIFIVMDTSLMLSSIGLPLLQILFNHRFSQICSNNVEPRRVLECHCIQDFDYSDYDDSGRSTPFWDFTPQSLDISSIKIKCFREDYDKTVLWTADFISSFQDDVAKELKSLIVEKNSIVLSDEKKQEIMDSFEDQACTAMKDEAREIFKLSNLKIFVLGNIAKIDSILPWRDFATIFQTREISYFGEFIYNPVPFEDLKKHAYIFEGSFPKRGSVQLVEDSITGVNDWAVALAPIDCSEQETLKILTCATFVGTTYKWKQLFYIYDRKLMCDMRVNWNGTTLRDLYLKYERIGGDYSHYKIESKWAALCTTPFRSERSLDAAMIKINSMLRDEEAYKVEKYGELILNITETNIKDTLTKYVGKLLDPKVCSVVSAVSANNRYSLAAGFELTRESQEKAGKYGYIINPRW